MAVWLPWKKPKTVFGNTNEIIKQAVYNINFPNINFDTEDGGRIAALIICSKILAQDVGRLPLKIYRTDKEGNKSILKLDGRYLALHNHPNKYTDSYKFWSTVEFIRSSTGNAYVKINYDSNNRLYLELLDNDCIAGPVLVYNYITGEKDLIYKYTEENKDEISFSSGEILHFTNLSSDGLTGRDPKEDLKINLAISFKALTTVDNFYNNGATVTKVLESTIPEGVNPIEWEKQREKFAEKYESFLNAGKVANLPAFTKLSDVGTSPKDAEYINTVKYNNGQIASYYGIPQHKIGNIESSKFNALSDLQEDYIKNTISPIIEMYRRELELKLLSDEELNDGYSIEFETGALTITDSKTRMENYKNLFGLGAITPNTIAKLENLPAYEGGSDHYLMSNYQSVEAYNKKIKNDSGNIQQSGKPIE
jgi:HK97 family phage portal protein